MSAVSLFPLTGVQQPPTQAGVEEAPGEIFSTAKIQRYAYYFFSFLATAGGTTLLVISLISILPLPVALASIPCYLFASYLASEGYHIWDYEDPKELWQARRSALSLSLLELAGKHGWKNLFYFTILTPQDFSTAFHHQAQSCDVTQLLLMRKAAEEGLSVAQQRPASIPMSVFTIPDLSLYQHSFHEESNGMKFDQVCKKYNFEDLRLCLFISQSEADLWQQLKNEYEQIVRECRIQIIQIASSFQNHQSSASRNSVFLRERFLQNVSSDSYPYIRTHVGNDLISADFFRLLTPEQNEQGKQALTLLEMQLEQKVKAINSRYEQFRSRNRR